MSIVSDFDDIARRLNRKQETKPEATADESAAAVRTLKMLGYAYDVGCDLWKPHLPAATQRQMAAQVSSTITSGYLYNYNQQSVYRELFSR